MSLDQAKQGQGNKSQTSCDSENSPFRFGLTVARYARLEIWSILMVKEYVAHEVIYEAVLIIDSPCESVTDRRYVMQ